MMTLAITGGASGIGLSVARRWVGSGGNVALLDIDPSRLTEAVSELGHDRALALEVDVTSDESVRDAYGEVGRELGELHGVVNCAGIAKPSPSESVPDAEWTRLIDIHLSGAMRSCRAAFPLLRQQESSAIVNVSSVAGSMGMPGRASYCAAKAGTEGLTRSLAVEWAAAGVRVNAIAPGYTRTPFTDDLVRRGQLRLDGIIGRTPLRRLAESDEISAAIQFLLSTESSFVTGHTLVVDGGLSIDGNWYGDDG